MLNDYLSTRPPRPADWRWIDSCQSNVAWNRVQEHISLANHGPAPWTLATGMVYLLILLGSALERSGAFTAHITTFIHELEERRLAEGRDRNGWLVRQDGDVSRIAWTGRLLVASQDVFDQGLGGSSVCFR